MRVLEVILNELAKSNDQILSENILLVLMNLSVSPTFKGAIADSGIIDSLKFNIVNGETTEEKVYAGRIIINIS